MSRKSFPMAVLAAGAWFLVTCAGRAEDSSAEEEAKKKLGFYFSLSLDRLSQHGQANGVGILAPPPTLGDPLRAPSGSEVNADFKGRFALGARIGFRLRQNHGRVEMSYRQFDEKQDLLTQPEAGKVMYNSLASPLAGIYEDLGNANFPSPPDGTVDGIEGGSFSETGGEGTDAPRDGAEDVNFNQSPDFLRFDTSDEIVGLMATNYRVFDADYVRSLKSVKRFVFDGRVGVRWAALEQNMDLAYRDHGSFAVYADLEGGNGVDEVRSCDYINGGTRVTPVQDGDGDGAETVGTIGTNEADGDGFMDGNCSNLMEDELFSAETVTEDRIVANIRTEGFGLKLGLDGRFQLSSKWSLYGGFAVTAMSTDAEFRYRESFSSERDRYLNFLDWDFNGDGRFDNWDLDFDGSCALTPDEPCYPNVADSDALEALGYQSIRTRLGANDSVVTNPVGLLPGAANAYQQGRLYVGQAVGEAERNRDILRESQLLHEASGKSSDFSPMLDLQLGIDYQFSKFASLGFGFHATRWYGAGGFRSIANDVLDGGGAQVGGDFALDGYYLMLTVVPR